MPRAVRPIRIDGDIAYVTLTRGMTAVIDSADATWVGDYNWYAWKPRNSLVWYAVTNVVKNGKKTTAFMHREILMPKGNLQVDHKDCDGLNNRRKNLREATHAQNRYNLPKRLNSSCALKGVSRTKTGRYYAQISYGGKNRSLGTFTTPEEAHDAYCEASARLHGEFGRTE